MSGTRTRHSVVDCVSTPMLPVRCEAGVEPLEIDQVFREHYAFVRRILRRWGVREPWVEDAVQDVFLVVTRRLWEVTHPSKVRSWVVSICRRVASNHRRGSLRKMLRLSVLRRHVPDATVEAPETALVESLLDELSDSQRAVFVLVEFEDWTAPEVSEALGIKLNTVYSRLRLAKKKIRSAYEREIGA